MKNLPLIVAAAVSLLIATLVLAGCDRSMDDINPEPISNGAYGPGTAFPTLMRTGGLPERVVGEDTTSEGIDTITEEDGVVADAEADTIECTISATYCDCLESKGNDLKYDEYCKCKDASSVEGGDKEFFCGCCAFAWDDSFPEHKGTEGSTEAWFYSQEACVAINATSPCTYDR